MLSKKSRTVSGGISSRARTRRSAVKRPGISCASPSPRCAVRSEACFGFVCSWYNLFLLHHVSPDRLLCLIREKEVHAEIEREQIDEILRREKSRVRREQTVPDSAPSDSPEPSHPEGDRLEPEQRQDKAPPRSLDDLCSAQQLIVDEVKEHYQDEVRLNPFQFKYWTGAGGALLSIVEGDPLQPEPETVVNRDCGEWGAGRVWLKEMVFANILALARRVRDQKQHSRGPKVYSLHAPEVE
jgi:hypothetical protein